MSLKETLSAYWLRIQEELLPWLNDTTCGPLNEHHKQLVSVLGMARIEAFLPGWPGLPGRPLSGTFGVARAFVAKAVFSFQPRLLIEMLSPTRRYAGCAAGSARARVPSEATISRAFARIRPSALPSRLHEALVGTHADRPIGHYLRGSTAIEAVKNRRTSDNQRPEPNKAQAAGPQER
jgi:hypothetical protein